MQARHVGLVLGLHQDAAQNPRAVLVGCDAGVASAQGVGADAQGAEEDGLVGIGHTGVQDARRRGIDRGHAPVGREVADDVERRRLVQLEAVGRREPLGPVERGPPAGCKHLAETRRCRRQEPEA